jgi:hypothetical protein
MAGSKVKPRQGENSRVTTAIYPTRILPAKINEGHDNDAAGGDFSSITIDNLTLYAPGRHGLRL